MKQLSNRLFFEWVEQEIAKGNTVQFLLKGNSMLPLLRSGKDRVVLVPCKENELKRMDVVLFRYQGNHVLHRIIDRKGSKLVLQGDGSYIAKEQCTTSDVIGRMDSIIRPSGKILSVTDFKWRMASFVWVHLGVFRRPLLTIIHQFL